MLNLCNNTGYFEQLGCYFIMSIVADITVWIMLATAVIIYVYGLSKMCEWVIEYIKIDL